MLACGASAASAADISNESCSCNDATDPSNDAAAVSNDFKLSRFNNTHANTRHPVINDMVHPRYAISGMLPRNVLFSSAILDPIIGSWINKRTVLFTR